jgi:hypothetical protein
MGFSGFTKLALTAIDQMCLLNGHFTIVGKSQKKDGNSRNQWIISLSCGEEQTRHSGTQVIDPPMTEPFGVVSAESGEVTQ